MRRVGATRLRGPGRRVVPANCTTELRGRRALGGGGFLVVYAGREAVGGGYGRTLWGALCGGLAAGYRVVLY